MDAMVSPLQADGQAYVGGTPAPSLQKNSALLGGPAPGSGLRGLHRHPVPAEAVQILQHHPEHPGISVNISRHGQPDGIWAISTMLVVQDLITPDEGFREDALKVAAFQMHQEGRLSSPEGHRWCLNGLCGQQVEQHPPSQLWKVSFCSLQLTNIRQR